VLVVVRDQFAGVRPMSFHSNHIVNCFAAIPSDAFYLELSVSSLAISLVHPMLVHPTRRGSSVDKHVVRRGTTIQTLLAGLVSRRPQLSC